jgi:hypothetical protein
MEVRAYNLLIRLEAEYEFRRVSGEFAKFDSCG